MLKEYVTKKILKALPEIEKVLGGGRKIYKKELEENQISVGKSE